MAHPERIQHGMDTSNTSKEKTLRRAIEPADTEAQPPKNADGDGRPAGRIVHDARGNAVWTWGAKNGNDPARISADSTSAMLRRLELPGLKVEGQEEAPAAGPAAAKATTKSVPAGAPQPDVSRGYNPYDQHKAILKPTTPKGPVKRKS
jgi:hypothetical protein